MAVHRSMPSASATRETPAVTLADLRDIVAEADRMELDGDRYVVRLHVIPFRFADLGVAGGSVASSLTLDDWPGDLDPLPASWPGQ